MRENRPYGSEGGESGSTGLPYPYRSLISAGGSTTCGSKPGGLVHPLPGSKAPVARCIAKSERPGGPIHRI